MKLTRSKVFVIYVAMLFCPVGLCAQKKAVGPFSVSHYDPKRNASDDLKAAIAEAQSTGKRILLQVGGNWCSWCRTMEKFYQDHPELLTTRKQNYVFVTINFSLENRNEAFLSHYPAITGYPHIFILDQNGNMVHSQDTSELELGKSYNLNKFLAFLKQFAPPSH